MRFDVFVAPSMRPRAAQLMEALVLSGSRLALDVQLMRHYAPREGSVLVTYGLGGRDRWPQAQQHARNGWRFVAFDAGYWERKTKDRRYRVSIDGFHCPQLIMRGPVPSAERLSGIGMTDEADAAGPIVLVGNGFKSRAIGAEGWAANKSKEIRAKLPGRRIVYRPKRQMVEPGVQCDRIEGGAQIEEVLSGASLVVCRHSNVAVDACRMGVPVVCDDGAAAAIYPSALERAEVQPDREIRYEFLRRLSWWQWAQSEIERGEAWSWLIGQLR